MSTAIPGAITRRIPNAVSIVRIVGAFALPFLMWKSWAISITIPGLAPFMSVPIVWIVFYLFLVFTDKLDGTLARKLNSESEFGAMLDVLGDAALLVIGVGCCLGNFARASMSTAAFLINIGIVAIILFGKVLVYIVSKKYFGVGNALHSVPHKVFAAVAYILIALWAFTSTMQLWTMLIMLAMMAYAIVDEIIYIVRTAEYDVDFKGHGFEKYALRKDKIEAAAA